MGFFIRDYSDFFIFFCQINLLGGVFYKALILRSSIEKKNKVVRLYLGISCTLNNLELVWESSRGGIAEQFLRIF